MRPRIAICGLNHGYEFVRSAHELRDAVDLVGLCAKNPDRHREQIERFGIPVFDRLESMLTDLSPDGVVIAVPTYKLAPMAKICLERNVSILLEKPGGVTTLELLELKRLASQSNARVMVGYHRRLARQVVALEKLLASGAIGTVKALSCRWVINKPHDYFRGWKASRALGGGCLMINVIHEFDLMQYILGPIDAVMAMGDGEPSADDVEHRAAVSLKFRGGAIGTLILSDQSPSPYSYDNTVCAESRFPLYEADYLCFFGSSGSLAFPSFTQHSNDVGGSWCDRLSKFESSDANGTSDDPIAREIQLFIGAMSGTSRAHASLDDAIRCLAVVEAIRRSLKSGAMEFVHSLGGS